MRKSIFTAASAIGAMCVAGFLAPVFAQAPVGRPDLGGRWILEKPVALWSPLEGGALPFTPAGLKAQAANAAARRKSADADPVEQCLPPGMPRLLGYARPFELIETPAKITFIHGFEHMLRHVYLDEPALTAEDVDPSYGGVSGGRWDGDALIVTTSLFNGKTWMDASGAPESDKAKVTEKYRLLPDGHLEDVITVEDPENYRAPWSARLVFARTDRPLGEDVCAEKFLPDSYRKKAG